MDAAALRSAAALADALLRRGEALAHPRRSQAARLQILLAFVSVARDALARVLAPAPPPVPEELAQPPEAAHGCAPLDASASDCPDEEELLDFVLGQLSPDAVAAMERHCDACTLCLDVIAAAAALDGDAPLLGRHALVADTLLPSLKRGGA